MLTVMLVSLPMWVLMLAWRGPAYAFGALAVLFLIVMGIGVLNRWMGGTKQK